MDQKKQWGALGSDPQAQKLMGDPAALKALLASPEAQKLMALLDRQAGDSLQSAAQAAAQGKPEALLGLLGRVTASGEGARAMEELKKKTGN